jgi:purine nucleoside phosphorylase
MSSSHEAVVATYLGIKVLGFSIVTDMAAVEYDVEEFPDHEAIVKVANLKAKDAEKLVSYFLQLIKNDLSLLD